MANSSSRTRSNRRAFTQQYGRTAFQVVSRIARGEDSSNISVDTGLPVSSVAAFRANVTRGVYAPYVRGDMVNGFTGNCRF